MAEEGKLGRFLNRKEYTSYGDNERSYRPRHKPPKDEERKDVSSDTRGVINIIIRGFSEEYPTLRAARDSVHALMKGPPKAITGGPIMKFDATISQPLQKPLTDLLVVTIKIGQMKVKRVLIDTGSTTDFITMDCFKQMKFEERHLKPIDKPLNGFGGNKVLPLETILLPVRVGEGNNCKKMSICFTVVDLNFLYNVIMGLPLINKLKVVISPHQLLLQYEQDDDKVGIVKGDQKAAHQCLINTLKHDGAPRESSKRNF